MNIKDELKEEFGLLSRKKVDYEIFEDRGLHFPMMSYEGNIVAGSGNIAKVITAMIPR